MNLSYQNSQARQGKGNSKSDILKIGKSLEQSKQWGQAIDAYLNAKQTKIESVADLEEVSHLLCSPLLRLTDPD